MIYNNRAYPIWEIPTWNWDISIMSLSNLSQTSGLLRLQLQLLLVINDLTCLLLAYLYRSRLGRGAPGSRKIFIPRVVFSPSPVSWSRCRKTLCVWTIFPNEILKRKTNGKLLLGTVPSLYCFASKFCWETWFLINQSGPRLDWLTLLISYLAPGSFPDGSYVWSLNKDTLALGQGQQVGIKSKPWLDAVSCPEPASWSQALGLKSPSAHSDISTLRHATCGLHPSTGPWLL